MSRIYLLVYAIVAVMQQLDSQPQYRVFEETATFPTAVTSMQEALESCSVSALISSRKAKYKLLLNLLSLLACILSLLRNGISNIFYSRVLIARIVTGSDSSLDSRDL